MVTKTSSTNLCLLFPWSRSSKICDLNATNRQLSSSRGNRKWRAASSSSRIRSHLAVSYTFASDARPRFFLWKLINARDLGKKFNSGKSFSSLIRKRRLARFLLSTATRTGLSPRPYKSFVHTFDVRRIDILKQSCSVAATARMRRSCTIVRMRNYTDTLEGSWIMPRSGIRSSDRRRNLLSLVSLFSRLSFFFISTQLFNGDATNHAARIFPINRNRNAAKLCSSFHFSLDFFTLKGCQKWEFIVVPLPKMKLSSRYTKHEE